jgi:hypothetical protein
MTSRPVNRRVTNREAQEETEARHVGRFLQVAALDAKDIPGDRPDRVLVIDGRRIGLEHQELTEEDLARNEPNIDWLEEALTAELLRLGIGQDLSVGVGVDAAAPFFRRRRDVTELVRRLGAFAAERAMAIPPEGTLELSAAQLAVHGIIGPRFVSLSRVAGSGGGHAFVSRGFWGPGDSAIEAAVRRKEELLPAYAALNPCLEEFWLLLVTGDRWEQATDSALAEWTSISTGFARVYLLDLRSGTLRRVDDQASR